MQQSTLRVADGHQFHPLLHAQSWRVWTWQLRAGGRRRLQKLPQLRVLHFSLKLQPEDHSHLTTFFHHNYT